jgi:hypothetical protein
MDWRTGFTARYIMTTVDPYTWGDTGEIEVIGGTIDRDAETDLLESASISIREHITEQWVRVYLIAKQGNDSVREALFTGLATTPTRSIVGNREENTLDCYSVLKVADDILLPLGYYAAAGVQGGQLVERLLSDLPCTVTVQENSPVLLDNIVAGSADSKLKMARQIVDAMGWQIRITGDGKVFVEPKPSQIAAEFNSQDEDVIEPQLTDDQDLFGIPNVLRVTISDSTATVRNDDPENEYSTVQRGREVWKAESSSSLTDNESLGAYAMRRLKELQAPARTLNYNRRFNPDVVPGSLVNIVYPKQGLDGAYRVQSQSIALSFNTRTEEEAVYEA